MWSFTWTLQLFLKILWLIVAFFMTVYYESMYTIKVLILLGTLWKHIYLLLHLIILSQKLFKKYFSAWSAKLLIMMMMSCSCGMVNIWKVFSLISSRDHCQRSSPSRISDLPQAGFEPAHQAYRLQKPIDFHWCKNVLLELFSLQTCLFFFTKWWNSLKTFVVHKPHFYQTFFLTDWCYMHCKNTVEIFSIYWNVLLQIFSNCLVEWSSTVVRTTTPWQQFFSLTFERSFLNGTFKNHQKILEALELILKSL